MLNFSTAHPVTLSLNASIADCLVEPAAMKAVDVLHRSIVAALGLTTAVVGVSFALNVGSAMNWHMEHKKQKEASDPDY